MKPSHHSVDVRGLKIHWLEWGERSAQPLVLTHGFLDHARSWDFFVEALFRFLGRSLWVVAPDCRGHGDSGWVGEGGYYHFFDYLLDLDTMIGALRVSQVMLVGHSMGGTISFLYAGTYPERVRKLVLIEGLGPAGLAFHDAPKRARQWLDGLRRDARTVTEYASLEDAARRVRQRNSRLSSERALHLARYGMYRAKSGRWRWKFDPLHRTTSPQPFYVEQAFAFLQRVRCPVLLVEGAESSHAVRTDLAERRARLKAAASVTIQDAGHMVHHDQPEQLAGAVGRFLEEC